MVITTFITYAYKGEKAENNAQLKEHTENLDLVYSESRKFNVRNVLEVCYALLILKSQSIVFFIL